MSFLLFELLLKWVQYFLLLFRSTSCHVWLRNVKVSALNRTLMLIYSANIVFNTIIVDSSTLHLLSISDLTNRSPIVFSVRFHHECAKHLTVTRNFNKNNCLPKQIETNKSSWSTRCVRQSICPCNMKFCIESIQTDSHHFDLFRTNHINVVKK